MTAPGTCGEDCQQLVYLARQVNIAPAAKPRAPATPWPPAASAGGLRQPGEAGLPAPAALRPDPALYDAGGGERPLLWVVDPHGNLVLRYDAKANGKKLLKDVQLLLSHIG